MNRAKKEAQNRRYARTPDGRRVDLREGTTLSREKWIELTNRADPMERSLRHRMDFERTEPPVEALTLFRNGTKYHLLHRGDAPITEVRYRTIDYDVNTGQIREVRLCTFGPFPPRTRIQIGSMDLPRFRRTRAELLVVEWTGGRVWTGRRALTMFEPSSGIPPLHALDLSPASGDPVCLDTHIPS